MTINVVRDSDREPASNKQAASKHSTLSLRNRLLITFILLASLPVLLTGIVSGLINAQGQRASAFDQLGSVAQLKANEINSWLSTLQVNLGLVMQDDASLANANLILQASADPASAKTQLRNKLNSLNQSTQYFEETFLMDKNGTILLSTEESQEGKIAKNQLFFQEGIKADYIAPPTYDVALSSYSIVFSRPVQNSSGQLIGVIAGRANLAVVDKIMVEQTGLGENGETYLVGTNYASLSKLRFGDAKIGETYIRTSGVSSAIESRSTGSGLYNNYEDTPVLGAYLWIPALQVALIAEQDESKALQASNQALSITIGLILLTMLIAGVAAFLVTGTIVNPISQLVTIAEGITSGNLEATAQVQRQDEIGVLATAFNTMTSRLRELISNLEKRVADRTKALETSAEISHRLTAILEPRELASAVVNEVRNAYDYYYAQIYLFDEAGENLVLTAGTGEAGAAMMKRGHSLPKGRGLAGRAADTKKSILVSDTSQDPNWLPNELLPDTKAEAVVPIFFGDKVMGVLDVQDDITNDINPDDITLLESLAGQVAISLQNASSYARAEEALQEAQSLVENAPEAIVIIDTETGLFSNPNENALKLFGLSREELSKTGPVQTSPLTQPDGSNSAEKAREKINETIKGATPIFEWTLLNKQGQEVLCEVRLVPMPGKTARARASITDISERKRVEEQIRRRAQQQESLNLITQRIQSATTIESALQVTARELGRALGQKPTLVTLEPQELIDRQKELTTIDQKNIPT